uniref:Uncharacterized protein n=1 Tax=Arundo donax TaxID=35708 RepID=A0A0A9GBC9_ARUDO
MRVRAHSLWLSLEPKVSQLSSLKSKRNQRAHCKGHDVKKGLVGHARPLGLARRM